MNNADSLARHFLEGLTLALHAASDADLAFAWTSAPRRTEFYRGTLMPSIARHLSLRPAYEILQVDYSFHERESGVPLVFIESENDSSSAAQEVSKLASLRAPLRVLFSVVPWIPDPRVWPPHGGLRDTLLSEWRAAAAKYDSLYGGPSGNLLVIIGEWRNDATLVFYAHSLSGSHDPVPSSSDSVLWTRGMTVTQASAATAG